MITTLVLVGSVANLINSAENLLILYLAMGIPLFLARALEPFVLTSIKNDLQNVLRCKFKSNQIQMYSEEPLCAFANSAMSIEFV